MPCLSTLPRRRAAARPMAATPARSVCSAPITQCPIDSRCLACKALPSAASTTRWMVLGWSGGWFMPEQRAAVVTKFRKTTARHATSAAFLRRKWGDHPGLPQPVDEALRVGEVRVARLHERREVLDGVQRVRL